MINGEVRESDLKYLRGMVEHPDPIVTSTELAEVVGVTQQSAHSKLSDLQERGLVKKKKVGARAVVWWLTTAGREGYQRLKSENS